MFCISEKLIAILKKNMALHLCELLKRLVWSFICGLACVGYIYVFQCLEQSEDLEWNRVYWTSHKSLLGALSILLSSETGKIVSTLFKFDGDCVFVWDHWEVCEKLWGSLRHQWDNWNIRYIEIYIYSRYHSDCLIYLIFPLRIE